MSGENGALLLLPSDKSAVSQGSLCDIVLWLFTEGLGSIALLHLNQVDIVVVPFKKLLYAGSLEFCLMLKHLL